MLISNTDQTCSCPRDCRLSAIKMRDQMRSLILGDPNIQMRDQNEGSKWGTPWKTSVHYKTFYRIEMFKGGFNWAPSVPRDTSLSKSKYEFYQYHDFTCHDNMLKRHDTMLAYHVTMSCYHVSSIVSRHVSMVSWRVSMIPCQNTMIPC